MGCLVLVGKVVAACNEERPGLKGALQLQEPLLVVTTDLSSIANIASRIS